MQKNIKTTKQKKISEMTLAEVKRLYAKIRQEPETPEVIAQIAELEKVLYESYSRNELPEKYAWELLKGGKFLATIVSHMPNKFFKKVVLRASLFGAEILLVGYVKIRAPRLDRYCIGSGVYVRLEDEFRQFYHELESESKIEV